MANSDNIIVATTLLDDFTAIKVKELIELRPWMKTKKFRLLTKHSEIEEYIDICISKGLCVYDLETNSLNTRVDSDGKCKASIVGVCLSHDPDEGIYIPVAHEHAAEYNVSLSFVLRESKRLAASCVLIFHNFKYDGQILRTHGITFESDEQYEDTYLMAAVQDASRKEKGLKHLSETLLDRPQLEIDDLGIQGTKKGTVAFYLVPPQKAIYYGGGDGMNTMALYLYLKAKLDAQDPTGREGPWVIYKMEKKCLLVTMEMERNLVKINKPYLEELDRDVEQRMVKIHQQILSIAGHEFDMNSTQQLGVVLFEELKLPYPSKVEKTKTGHYQTNSEVLEMVRTKNPIISLILIYRGYLKIRSTYLYNWLVNADENDEVKFQLNQVQADTGRFSGSGGKGLNIDGYCGVNCQNIPTFDKKNPHAVNLRKAMQAHKGFKMLSIDYSGEELRIATNFSHEPKWVNEFLHGTGDLHTITAQIITGKSVVTKQERGVGKCVARGTLIAAERGWIPIEELKPGDRVITHTGALKPIDSVHFMGVKRANVIETKTGHKITCGVNHRFLSAVNEWIRAEDLQIGQKIKSIPFEEMSSFDGVHVNITLADVTSVESAGDVELWDLTVADDHTYVAQGLVTHNTLNFLTMYGGGAGGFAAQAKVPFETAKKMIVNFFKEYVGLNSWIKKEWKASRKRGYSRTAFGRRRPLEEFYNHPDKGIQSKGDRCAVNGAVQGCLQGTERILTNMGYIPILELYNMPTELLCKMKVWTGTSWETFDVLNRGEAQFAEIELSNGMVLNCDTRHEVLVVGKDGYEFRHFNDLDEDTQVCVSIPTIKQFGEYPEDYTYESTAHNGKSLHISTKEQWDFIGYLMGYVIGDGGIRTESRQALTISLGAEKIKKYLPNIEESLEGLGLYLSKIRKTNSAKGESYQVQINSKGLVDLFIKLGYVPSGARVKRVPEIILRVPVDMRKAFIQGYLDTDGSKKRQNRYGYHTHSSELLRDVQLIGWTLGLPSVVRADNFKLEWQDFKKVEGTLDISPEIYYHYKLKRKTVLAKKEDTYTLSVHSDLHRFDSAGIISKNTGADIIKIALWRVYKWVKENNLQDDVKILLPVHDEVLYEVREDKLDMVVPELCRLMKIRDVTDKLKWEVPLEVDAEYGDTFDVDHDYWKELKDRMKETSAPEQVEPAQSVPEEIEHLDVPAPVEEPIEEAEEQPASELETSTSGTTYNDAASYCKNLTVMNGYPESATRLAVQSVLKQINEKQDQALIKDAHTTEHIDREGYFNYTIDVDIFVAHKIRYILETLRSADKLLIGPKNRLCLLSKDGEVFHKSSEEISVDAFLALCITFNI